MNKSNIELNFRYKYKNLCEVLEIEEKHNTCSKNSQLKELSTIMDITKEKTFYTISEIYEVALDKIDDRKGHSGKSEGSRNNYEGIYLQYSTAIMLNTLNVYKETYGNIMYGTANQLALRIGIVNNNYAIANSNRDKFSNYTYKVNRLSNFTSRRDCFDALSEIVKPCIVSTLNKLQNNGDIDYLQTILIYNGNDCRVATDKEISIINKVEDDVLLFMEIENKQVLRHNNKIQKNYYDEVNNRVKKLINLSYFCTGFKIIIFGKNEEIIDITETKALLNKIILERATKKLKKKTLKIKQLFKKPLGFTDCPKWDKDRLNIDYMIEAEETLYMLVGLKYKDISKAIKETVDTFKKDKRLSEKHKLRKSNINLDILPY